MQVLKPAAPSHYRSLMFKRIIARILELFYEPRPETHEERYARLKAQALQAIKEGDPDLADYYHALAEMTPEQACGHRRKWGG